MRRRFSAVLIESVHMFYFAGTKYWQYVSIFLRFCLNIHEVIVSNIVFVKFSRHVGGFSSHNGCYKTNKCRTKCDLAHGVNTTVNYRNMAGLRTASMKWCWHITSSSTNSPCCLLVEIYQRYLLQQCLDQGQGLSVALKDLAETAKYIKVEETPFSDLNMRSCRIGTCIMHQSK